MNNFITLEDIDSSRQRSAGIKIKPEVGMILGSGP